MATVTVAAPSIPVPTRFGSSTTTATATSISETLSSLFDTTSRISSSFVGRGQSSSSGISRNNNNRALIAPFHIDELVVGKQVYDLCDDYCNVYQVQAIRPTSRQFDTNPSNSYYYSSSSVAYSKSEQLAREFVSLTANTTAASGNTSSSKQSLYVAKYIKEHMYNTMESDTASSFEVAANRLANEVDILSSIPYHPNVAGIRGVATCGTEAYYLTGRHDGYFALFDAMKELLSERILQWKRQRDRYTVIQYIVGCAIRGRRRVGASRGKPTTTTARRRRSSVRKSAASVVMSVGGNSNRSRKNCTLLLERLHVALDISKAIEHLHEHGIVHGKIKMKNIGFDDEDKVQLFGFGSAYQHQDDDAESYDGLGKKKGGFASDVLDFTTFLFELLLLPETSEDCKHHRKQFVNMMNTLHQRRRSSHTTPNKNSRRSSTTCQLLEGYYGSLFMDVPYEILTLIEKGWSIDPSKRPSMSEIRKSLYHVLITTQEQR